VRTSAAWTSAGSVQLISAPYIPPLPPPAPVPKEVQVGAFTAKPYAGETKLGVKVGYKGKTHGLKLTLDLALLVDHPRIRTGETVVGGKVVRSGFLIEGVKGLEVSVAGGAENGSFDNEKVSLEIPLEVNVAIPPAFTEGIPLAFKVSYAFTVETAFSGNNSTLFANGRYGLDGNLGILNGVASVPTFSVQKSIIDSISGIPVGVSGIVFGMSMKLLAGIGTAAGAAGPFGTFDATVGLTNGSALGAVFVRCHGAKLIVNVGGGVGLEIPGPVAKAINALLPLPAGLEVSSKSVGVKKKIVDADYTVPNVPLCKA
jgi:hypothetical protein